MCVKIKGLRILVLFLAVLGTTSCSIQNEAMDGDVDNNIVIKNSSTERPDKDIDYKVFKGKIRGVDSLAKPEIYFPANSGYKQLKNETREEGSIWEDKADNYLLVEPGRVMYTTKEFYNTFASLLYDEKGVFRDNFDEILEKKSIWGVSEEEAISIVQNLIEKNNISIKNTKAYSLTKENLTKLSKMFMSDEEYKEYIKDPTNEPMKRVFTKHDEGYLVVMGVCAGENVLYPNEYDYGKRYYPGSYIWAIVNKDGLVTFQAEGIYDVETSSSEETRVLSLEQAKKALNEKFNNLISANKAECKEIQKSFLAVSDGKSDTVSFIPVYIFMVEQKTDVSKGDEHRQVTENISLILDMENGKWIE